MTGDVVTWGAIAVAIGSVISIITFWTRYSDRITKAEAAAAAADRRAETAIGIAQEAKKDAHETSEKIAIQAAAFGLYREQIAKDYIHREVMGEVEDRLTSAIDRLGERLDRFASAVLHPKN